MRNELWAVMVLTASLGAGCDGSNTGDTGNACAWESSASSGGLCQSDYACNDGTHRGINCAGDDCVCSTDNRPGGHFNAPGFCALDTAGRDPVFASHCLGPTDASVAADARAD